MNLPNTLSYIIWNGSPEIFTLHLGDFNLTLRWYGLLFALGFLVTQQILYYIYKKEGKPEKDVDTITIFMVVATILGARLGHVFFYEPKRYLQNPIDILKVWEGGLASHGAAIAILIALFLYSRYFIGFYKTEPSPGGKNEKKVTYGFFFERKSRPGQSYLQVVDRIVILVALTGALIRLGNFFNSEIIGLPTKSDYGIVFARSITELFSEEKMTDDISYVPADSVPPNANQFQPVVILVDFKKHYAEEDILPFMRDHMNTFRLHPYYEEAVDQSSPINYHMGSDADGKQSAIVNAYLIPRHPAQLYESISCVFLFLILFAIWRKYKADLPEGRLLGLFLIVCFGLRFVFEYVKENQVDFENKLPLNMGQFLSIPLVIMGIIIFIWSFRKKGIPTATK